ncbi:MAG TPA: alpha/beta hydrolase [Candidatus Binatia bacterium]|jgi:non-heme chloroperoxidase|nr:alpha/beta hydrolase [Candidatus Binatia bacterium]
MTNDEVKLNPQRVSYQVNNGVKLMGDAWGESDAAPVLLLHGGGQTRHAWGGTARALAEQGWYAVALDLRGHGDSGWSPDGNYQIDVYVEDLHRVLPHFKQRPVLVGASLGGMTALLTAGEAPQPVSTAVVLVDITPRVEQKGVDRIRAFMTARPEGFANLEEVADTIAEYIPHRPRPKDLSGLQKNLRLRADGRYRWHWDPQLISPERFARRRDPERLLAAARSLRVPTMLVRGGISDVVSEETTKEFLAAVPHAKYVDVAGAGHMVAGDRNDAFSKAVIGFLTEVKPLL